MSVGQLFSPFVTTYYKCSVQQLVKGACGVLHTVGSNTVQQHVYNHTSTTAAAAATATTTTTTTTTTLTATKTTIMMMILTIIKYTYDKIKTVHSRSTGCLASDRPVSTATFLFRVTILSCCWDALQRRTVVTSGTTTAWRSFFHSSTLLAAPIASYVSSLLTCYTSSDRHTTTFLTLKFS